VIRSPWFAVLFACSVVIAPAHAQGGGAFHDPVDGSFDMSDWLLRKKGFLPVPIIITEPALGYGGGLALAWFRRPGSEGQSQSAFPPPTIAAAAGFYTAGGSYGGGLGFFHPFRQDRFRYLGLAAVASLHLKFFGFDPNGPLADDPRHYTIRGLFTNQRLQARLGQSSWFLGANYTFLSSKTRFETSLPAEIAPGDVDVKLGGLGTTMEYDTRDNFLDARRGVDLSANVTWYEPAFGSDRSFGKLKVAGLFYAQPRKPWEIAFRVDARSAWGDTPFFYKPYLAMRGLEALEYTDNVAALSEAELRYGIGTRWTVLGFGGAGWTGASWSALGNNSAVPAGGFGLRYLIARQLGLRTGLDFAFGPNGQFAFYIQTGSPWR